MRLTRLLSLILVAAPACSRAQSIPRSQLATVSQMIGDARVEIIYRRPDARGRELFGFLVPFGRVWSPSADSAAVFSTTKDLEVAGVKVPAGRYSLWAIPDRDSWTLIFNSVTPVFHMRYPQGKDVVRVHAKPKSGDHMETLAFYFPVVDEDSAVLNLHWGKTVVPFAIKAKQ
jgi:Protein of unknown function (DUF2911).